MGTRSVWKGALTLALLSIGVRCYKVVKKSNISFRMLHKEDETPIEMKRRCKKCGKEVGWNDLVKGYEITEDSYIVFSDEEIASLSEEGTGTIKITECIGRNMIDTAALGDFYFLVPEKGFDRAYLLLLEALRSVNGVLIGRWVYHGKENVVGVTAREGVLMLAILRYAEEITSVNDIPAVNTKEMPSAEEITLAIELLKKYTNPKWKLPDSSAYVAKFTALMNAKQAGVITGIVKEVKEEVKPGNLMAELRNSLMVAAPATTTTTTTEPMIAAEPAPPAAEPTPAAVEGKDTGKKMKVKRKSGQ